MSTHFKTLNPQPLVGGFSCAFGMNMHGLSSSASLAKPNAYKYNGGTELTADFGWEMYDTPNRSYDAQLGRFHQVDPLADSQSSFTPYHFGYNNPIFWNDPTGLSPDIFGMIDQLLNSDHGGSWSASGGINFYESDEEAFWNGYSYMDSFNVWDTDMFNDATGGSNFGAIENFYSRYKGEKSQMGSVLFKVLTNSGKDPWSNYKLNIENGIFRLSASLDSKSTFVLGIYRFNNSGKLVDATGIVNGLAEYRITEFGENGDLSYTIFTESLAAPLARVMQAELSKGHFPFLNTADYISAIEGSFAIGKIGSTSDYYKVQHYIRLGTSFSHLEDGFTPSKFTMWAPSYNSYLKFLKN